MKPLKYFRNPLILWILANLSGFGLLGLAVLLVPGWLANAGFIVSILVISIPVSIAQWLVLRKTVAYSWLWIFAMPVGLLLGILLLRSIPESVWQIVGDESIVTLPAGIWSLVFWWAYRSGCCSEPVLKRHHSGWRLPLSHPRLVWPWYYSPI